MICEQPPRSNEYIVRTGSAGGDGLQLTPDNSIIGDFEIIAEFKFGDINTEDSAARIMVGLIGLTGATYSGILEWIPTSDSFRLIINGGAPSSVSISFVANKKVLIHIIRSDDNIEYYYDDGGGWTLIGTSSTYAEPLYMTTESNLIGGFTYYNISAESGLESDIPSNDIKIPGNTLIFVYNNTVYNCQNGIVIDARDYESYSNYATLRNNIVLECEQLAFSGVHGYPKRLDIDYCLSDDETLRRFSGTHNLFSSSVIFKNKTKEDYRISLYDSTGLANGIVLSADGNYTFYTDSKGQDRGNKWDIGFDNYTYTKNGIIPLSIGAADPEGVSTGRTMSITSGILQFSTSDIGQKIGIGDKINYQDGFVIKYCYLAEKGFDAYTWYVVDINGTSPSDCTDASVLSIKRITNTLAAMMSTQLAIELGFTDLVANDVSVEIYCYKDAIDYQETAITGWTTDSDHAIKITVPYDTYKQVVSSQRHAGYWGDGYTIQWEAEQVNPKITIDNDDITIEGFQIDCQLAVDAILINSGNRVVISRNIIKNAYNGITHYSGSINVIGNIVFDHTNTGISISDGYGYSNTVNGGTLGFACYSPSELINCLGTNSAGGDFIGTAIKRYCISSDGSAGTDNECRDNASIIYNDTSNDDYTLIRYDYVPLGHGLDLIHIDEFDELIDISSTEINKWSIGASCPDFETSELYFSVCYDQSNIRTGIDTTVTISDGIVIFSAEQTNTLLGVGAKMIYGPSNSECYLCKKIDNYQWEVKTKYGLLPENILNVELVSITHSYPNIANALSEINTLLGDVNNPFIDLVASKVKLNFPVYKSNQNDAYSISISNFITDLNFNIRVYTPYDVRSECNSSQRHLGIIDPTLNVIVKPTDVIGGAAISIASDYTTIEGLIIEPRKAPYSNNGINFNESFGSIVMGCIIHNGIAGIKNNSNTDLYYDDFTNKTFNPWWNGSETKGFKDSFVIINDPVTIGRYIARLKPGRSLTGDYILTPDSITIPGDFDIIVGIMRHTSDSGSDAINVTIGNAIKDICVVRWASDEIQWQITGGPSQIKTKILTIGIPILLRITRVNGLISCQYDIGSGWENVDDSSVTFWTITNYSDCVVKVLGSDVVSFSSISIQANGGIPAGALPCKMINNVIYDMTDGVEPGGIDVIYNNTVVNCSAIGIINTEYDDVIGNITQECGTSGFDNDETLSYNLSDDSSCGSSNSNKPNIPLSFKSPLSNDYRLNQYDSDAKGTSAVLSGNLTYAFQIDATGFIRSRNWDRGALEYIPLRRVVFMVSNNPYDLKSPPNSSTSFEIIPYGNLSIIKFGDAQINPDIACGCKVTAISQSAFPDGCFLFEKIDNYQWYVTDKMGNSFITSISGRVSSITRVFSHLNLAASLIYTSSYLGTTNLVSDDIQVSIACCKSIIPNQDIYPCSFGAILSNVDCFLRIFVPYDTDKHCNKSQWHYGRFGYGYSIEAMSASNFNYGLKITGSDYTEIEGLSIKANNNAFETSGIILSSCHNSFINSNIIESCKTHAILSTMTQSSESKEIVVNNLIYDCGNDGIRYERPSELTESALLFIMNNTIRSCNRSVYIKKPEGTISIICLLTNNIFQASRYRNIVCDHWDDRDNFYLDHNISSDESTTFHDGDFNRRYTNIEFISVSEDNYDLAETDIKAIDSAKDLSSDINYSFTKDIALRDREVDSWDVGAFELVRVTGSGAMTMIPVSMASHANIAGSSPLTHILYLRDTLKPGVPDQYEFTSIANLNAYILASIPDFDNLIIYVQGAPSDEVSFEGRFELNSRSERTVIIATDPDELADGPATIRYTTELIDDSSQQSLVTFQNIKIFNNDAMDGEFLLSGSALTTKIRFENCIIQVKNDSLINTDSCSLEIINSILIYRNSGSVSDLYLGKSGVSGNLIVNSSILSFSDDDLNFYTTNIVNTDQIHNCLSYNYGNGDISFDNPTSLVYYCYPDIDPLYMSFELVEESWTPGDIIDLSYIPIKQSPLINKGDNEFVSTISVDIMGNTRIFLNNIVDIGPYEVELYQITFDASVISKIFQDKLFLDDTNERFTTKEKIYSNLFIQFADNPTYRIDFARESKCLIELKSFVTEFIFEYDKFDIDLVVMEAYLDVERMTIVISKPDAILGEMFNSIIEQGKYIFYFDDITHTLTVKINHTFDKGMSGARSVLNNVRFGGLPVLRY